MRHIRADRPVRPYTRLPSVRPVFFSVIPRARSARGNPSPFHINGGQRPPPTFAASRQRRDLIIAHTPGGCFQRGGGPQPSLFGRSRMGDFQGGRKIETSFPLEWRFWLLLPLLTKVTRRRQKKKNIPGGQTRPPLHTPTAHRSFPVIPSQCSHWRGNPHPRARRRGLPKTHQDLRPRRRSCPQFSYNISRATGR